MSKNISILIPTNDDSTMLRDTLPRMLSQQYDAAFEVIVVRETRQGAVKDIIEPYLDKYGNLCSTFMPDKPQYITDNEIKLLLGVKAAKYDDIVVVPPTLSPSPKWLEEVGGLLDINQEYPVLIGDAHYYERMGFFARRRERKATYKMLKPWCKTVGQRRKDLMLSKADRHSFSISFHRSDYLNDLQLRSVVAAAYSI